MYPSFFATLLFYFYWFSGFLASFDFFELNFTCFHSAVRSLLLRGYRYYFSHRFRFGQVILKDFRSTKFVWYNVAKLVVWELILLFFLG